MTANLQTIAHVHQGVLEALVAKLASLGLVERRELVELGFRGFLGLFVVGFLLWVIVKPVDGRKFSDVNDNAVFWHFVVVTWVLVYVMVYWVPRWL